MKRLLIIVALVVVSVVSMKASERERSELAKRVNGAVALLYSQDNQGGLTMFCTATVYQKVPTGYRFATAAHCVGSDQEDKAATTLHLAFFLTFDEKDAKTFWPAVPISVGYQTKGDDFAIFEVTTVEEWTVVEIGDEHDTSVGDEVLNVSSPLGLGKQAFFGTISSARLERPTNIGKETWKGNVLVQLAGSGPGSSGSAIISVAQGKIIGFLVGGIQDRAIVAIPASRFTKFREQVEKGKYKWYVAPEKED